MSYRYNVNDMDNWGIREARAFSYEQSLGLIPDGYDVNYTCESWNCVNPDHMELVRVD
jgi:hypothetical protein